MSVFDDVTPIAYGEEVSPGLYDQAVLFLGDVRLHHPFAHVTYYDEAKRSWSQGTYYANPAEPYFRLRGWDWPEEGGGEDA